MRVLGVDTSLRSTGIAVLETCGNSIVVVEYGVIKISQAKPVSECLRCLSDGIGGLIQRTSPQAVAIEGIFYCKNVKTAVALGEARGVVISVCASAGLPVFEYSPKKVKQAAVGYGSAGKDQVMRMVTALLKLPSAPAEDACDAMAIAICHLHSNSAHQCLAPSRI